MLELLIFWLLILSGDALIGTIMFRYTTSKWWWQKEKNKSPWSFNISPDGWSFGAKDFNPLQTIKRVYEDLTGQNQSVEDSIKSAVNKEVSARIKSRIQKELSESSEIDEYISETVQKTLKDMFGGDK